MSALASDKLKRTANGGIPAIATVQSPRTAGVTSLSVDTQQFWPTATGIAFSTYQLDADGDRKAGTQIDWEGVSNGTTTISSMVRTGGAADADIPIGYKVQMGPTSQWAEDLIEGVSNQHNFADGTHKDITTNTITTSGDATVGGNAVVAGSLTVSGSDVSTRFAPTGEVSMFAAVGAPAGWLLCNGSAVNRTTYATLFGVIGTTYGTGDGSTTFNVPNFKGKTPFGVDSGQSEFATLAAAGGQKDVQSHNHGVSDPGHNHAMWTIGQESNTYTLGGSSNRAVLNGGTPNSGNGITGTRTTGVSINNAGTGANNLNPYLTVNFIIKT